MFPYVYKERKTFLKKKKIVSVLGLVGHLVSDTATQLCRGNVKAGTDIKQVGVTVFQ